MKGIAAGLLAGAARALVGTNFARVLKSMWGLYAPCHYSLMPSGGLGIQLTGLVNVERELALLVLVQELRAFWMCSHLRVMLRRDVVAAESTVAVIPCMSWRFCLQLLACTLATRSLSIALL